jgi:hypothetical protein
LIVRGASAFVLAVALLSTGCASIVGKSVFPVTINSDPSGSDILIKDEKGQEIFAGKTPTTVTLDAGEAYFHAKSYQVHFSKAGYGSHQAVIRAQLSGWYIGNVLFGGLIGWLIVDPITGKMWKLPTDLTVKLPQ